MAHRSTTTVGNDATSGILATLVIVTVTISFGFGYGHANHNTYLIDGLTKLDPGFLRHDWFARETIHYHPTFSYVVKLAATAGSFAWNLALLNAALTASALFLFYKFAVRMSSTDPLGVFVLFAFFVVLERTATVGDAYLFQSYLQPATFGYWLTLLALWYFTKRNYFASGIALAASGAFHTNFLLLGIVVFGIAHLLLGTEKLALRLFLQFGGSLALLLDKLPFLLNLATNENAGRAREIFTTVRSPHHYVPLTYLWDFAPFYGWHAMAIGASDLADIDEGMRKRFKAVHASLLAAITVATLLTTVVFVPFVSQLFVWRLAPLSLAFAQLVCLSAAVRYLSVSGDLLPDLSNARLALIATGFALIVASYQHDYRLFSARQVAMAVYVGTIASLLFTRYYRTENAQRAPRTPETVQAFGLALLILAVWATAPKTRADSTLLNGFPGRQQAELYAWARRSENTATFLVPPDATHFRLHGRRAIVVDWKSIPVDPEGTLEWYERLADISGVEGFRSEAEVVSGYGNMDVNRVRELQRLYGATHLVRYVASTGNDSARGLEIFPTVFRNDMFEVKALSKP